MNIIKFIKKHSVFAIIFSLLVGASSCLNFEEEEEEKPLLSAIDGEEYYQTLQGEMSVEKAFILIDKDSVELVPTIILFETSKDHKFNLLKFIAILVGMAVAFLA